MDLFQLKAVERTESGKGPSRRDRVKGFIPCICYGKSKKALSVVIGKKDFVHALNTEAGVNVLIKLEISKGDGKQVAKDVLIKEIQYHTVKDEVVHVDFKEISLHEKITAKVPVEVAGESVGVKAGGVVERPIWEIEVECLPTEIPEMFKLDISELDIGDSLKVADIKVDPKIKIVTDIEQHVVNIVPPTKEEEVVAAPEEGIEGEEITEPEVIAKGKKEEEGEEGEEAAEEGGKADSQEEKKGN